MESAGDFTQGKGKTIQQNEFKRIGMGKNKVLSAWEKKKKNDILENAIFKQVLSEFSVMLLCQNARMRY